jgi:hypothetical protein
MIKEGKLMKNFTNNLKNLITAYGVDAALEAIEEKLKNDILAIDAEIRRNKRFINDLAEKQKNLKATKRGLYEILRQIR